eukprot:5476954-Pyramimonas_sp.AAC.1
MSRQPQRKRAVTLLRDDDFARLGTKQKFYHTRRCKGSVPPGPKTLSEFSLWPERHWQAVAKRFGGARSIQLWSTLLGHGAINTGDYSGCEMPRGLCWQLCAGLRRAFPGEPCVHHVAFDFERSCDNGCLAQRTLLWIASNLDGGSSCAFGDIGDTLPLQGKEYLDMLMPTAVEDDAALAKQQAAKRYADMLDWLLQNR